MLVTDFETRSRVNLKAAGAWRYATDPSTEVICCGFKLGERRWMWHSLDIYGDDADALFPPWLVEAIENNLLAAFNAAFDRLIWEHVAVPRNNFPPVSLNRWYCVASLARINALPGNLDDASRAINPNIRKDHRGAALIRKLCIPRGDGTFDEDSKSLHEMAAYCAQDLEATDNVIKNCRPMLQSEHHDWQVNERVNAHGITIDSWLATNAVRYAYDEAQEIAAELNRLTNGRITKHTQSQRIRDYAKETLEDCGAPLDAMVRYKDGVKKYSIDKAARAQLLDRAQELDLPFVLVRVLELTDDGSRSSVAKFQRMLNMASPVDNRVRGAFIHAGAGQTQRFSSRGLQLHNMVRACWTEDETENVADLMAVYAPIQNCMSALAKLLRPTLVAAEGCQLVVGDWSAIEAMALPWLAGETPGALADLKLFSESPGAVYERTASDLGTDDRQLGKVARLSFGYGGGKGALQAMARGYQMRIDDNTAQTLPIIWRRHNAWAVDFWRSLERAARRAIAHPGTQYTAGRVAYQFAPALLGGTLLCILPGETVIQYPQARIEQVQTKFGLKSSITALKAAWKPAADATTWPRVTLWHGLLAENADQAFCASILRHTLRRLDSEPGPGDVVMHVHDEPVVEAPEDAIELAAQRLHDVMNDVPEFAAGLPLRAEVSIVDRYGKS